MQFEITIPHSQSLKDKRRVVKSLKDRLHREHMIAVAEVAALDEQRTAVLALSLVSNSAAHASAVMDRIVEKVRSLPEARLGGLSRDLIHESELQWEGDPVELVSDDPQWRQEERRMADEAERLWRREGGS